MALSWFTEVLLTDAGYQPRHRSTRRTGKCADRLDSPTRDHLAGQDSKPAPAYSAAGACGSTEEHPTQDFLDQLTLGEIRRILEGCALDDLTTVVPELVQLVAHSSHTPATLTKAWSEFEETTRDVYGLHLGIRDWSALFRRDEVLSFSDEDAMAMLLSYADDAWRLITRGQSGVTAAVPSGATTGYSR